VISWKSSDYIEATERIPIDQPPSSVFPFSLSPNSVHSKLCNDDYAITFVCDKRFRLVDIG
jgi:hypothetical protein